MTAADLPAVDRVEAAAHPHPRNVQAFADELGAPQAHLWVAEDHELVGLLDFWCVLDEVELLDVAVHPSRQGQGIGRRLMAHLFAEARRLDARIIHLEVGVGNEPARALYGDLGFREVGRRRRYYADGEDALVLSAMLSG